MSSIVFVVIAAFFLAMGLYALILPASLARPFRIRIDAPEARSEIRAVYGGFGIAIAAVLVIAMFTDTSVRHGIAITVGAALAGMAFGRVVSRLADRPTAFYPVWFYFLVEVVAAGALFWAG